ncbi:NAD-dependent succinate-semialdehyde dehydrogenase [Acetobacteraceae bacterium KSS8]|uniref:NAD-dependent succinate-semialdehyde dehydrogenase n=1 Tax=Endosaccharibacter trunci TaxID=2812733 RepID=A0ABT1W7U5_9PROT|nr:NAD-dependent succinate-semialdehyde dehydrogenase [Acetobacteraceae bacterium KSS8]
MPDMHAISRNPATGEEIGRFAFLTASEVEQTLANAAAAQKRWAATPIEQRAAIMTRLASVMRERVEEAAAIATAEMGKTLREARAEVEKCAATADWFARNGARHLADEPAETDTADEAYVSFLPIGVILGVMPWNFPYWQAVRAALPILLGGNGFILKHAPNVMRAAFLMEEMFRAAGLPEHVFSVLNVDTPAIESVIADRRIAAVTLTGSTRAGAAVASLAGRHLKKSVLELGGTDAFIVLADADLDGAVRFAIAGRFANAGQVCLAAKRIILERPIAEAFTQRFLQAAREQCAGDPTDERSTMGPIARGDLRDGVHDQVQHSVAAGAALLLGGELPEGPGFFYPPTVLADVKPGMAAFDEEVFGPVAALVVAEDAEHALLLANTSEYGLSGNIWTADEAKARTLARRMETGGVFVNGFTASNARVPVGGVKKSGYGRELSYFGLREFTNAQTVWTRRG